VRRSARRTQATVTAKGIATSPRFETVCVDGVPDPQSSQPLQRRAARATMISPA
jgi:hypothetical protein